MKLSKQTQLLVDQANAIKAAYDDLLHQIRRDSYFDFRAAVKVAEVEMRWKISRLAALEAIAKDTGIEV
jgi:hypothetical protein